MTTPQQLTPRQAHLLAMIADGYPDPQIAAELGITLSAARGQTGRLLARLGATNRAHAVGIGYRTGLLTLEDA